MKAKFLGQRWRRISRRSPPTEHFEQVDKADLLRSGPYSEIRGTSIRIRGRRVFRDTDASTRLLKAWGIMIITVRTWRKSDAQASQRQ